MARGEERRQRAAFRDPEQRGLVDPDGIHHRAHVVHALVHRRQLRNPIGKPGTALVEQDHPAALAEPLQPAREPRLGPVVVDMRDEARRHHQVDRTFAEHLVGDVDLAALGVTGSGRLHRSPRAEGAQLPREYYSPQDGRQRSDW
jgi:hypothetical protein